MDAQWQGSQAAFPLKGLKLKHVRIAPSECNMGSQAVYPLEGLKLV